MVKLQPIGTLSIVSKTDHYMFSSTSNSSTKPSDPYTSRYGQSDQNYNYKTSKKRSSNSATRIRVYKDTKKAKTSSIDKNLHNKFRQGCLPKNNVINNKLQNHLPQLHNNAKKVFKFIVKNTYPDRTNPLLKKSYALIGKLFRLKEYLLDINCVMCSVAVDRTLKTLVIANKNIRLYQFKENYREDVSIKRLAKVKEDGLIHTESTNNIVPDLLDEVEPGKRAIIQITHAGTMNGHAMNLVRMKDGRDFILCGQTDQVWDLNNKDQVKKIQSLFGPANDTLGNHITYHITGNSPRIPSN